MAHYKVYAPDFPSIAQVELEADNSFDARHSYARTWGLEVTDVVAINTRTKQFGATPKPAYGSQEWAETYSDDLGESPDY